VKAVGQEHRRREARGHVRSNRRKKEKRTSLLDRKPSVREACVAGEGKKEWVKEAGKGGVKSRGNHISEGNF